MREKDRLRLREIRLQLEEAEKKHFAESERAAKRIKDLESKVKLVKKKLDEAAERILRLESSKTWRENHIAMLQRQLDSERELRDVEVK